jgi:hypothetical protein
MYETDIFVKFKFRFIGMPIFITNEAQTVLTYRLQKWHKLIPGALKWIFLTLSDVKTRHLSLFFYMLTILTICALFSFLLVRIPDTQRAQTGLIFNSWGKFLRT